MGSPQGQQQRAQAAAPAAEQEVATPAGPPSGGAHAPAAAEREGQPASKRPRLEGQLSTGQLHVGEQLQLMAFPAPGQTPPAVDPSWVNAEGSFRVEACHPPSTAFLTLSLGGHQWKGALVCPPSAFLETARPASAPLKKPRTPFNFFSDAVRPSIKEQHPQADQKGISKLVGEQWAQLPADEREPYNEQARQDRERYERELREFQNRFPQGSRRDLQRRAGPPTARQELSQVPQAEAPLPHDRARLASPRDTAAAVSPWAAAGPGGDVSGSAHGSGLPPLPAPPPPGQLTAWLSSIAREGSVGGGGSRNTSGGQLSASGGTFPSPTAGGMLPPVVQMAQAAALQQPSLQASMQGVPPSSQLAALQALQAMLQADGQAGQPPRAPAAAGPPQSMALSQLLGRVLGGELAPPAVLTTPASPAAAGAQATADLVSLLVRLAQPPGGQQPPPLQQPGGQ